MKNTNISAAASFLLACAAFGADIGNPDLHANQVGMLTSLPKVAVLRAPGLDSSFTVVTEPGGVVVHSGFGTRKQYWAPADDTVRSFDFSELTVPGKYRVKVAGSGVSYPFEIGKDALTPLTKAAIKSYYYQRASTALPSAFAGTYARSAGHPDNAVLVHNSAASAGRPANSTISSPKGWYDAGDYGKYIVNSGITVWTLLQAYLMAPKYFDTLQLNIPESGNDLPDLIDEVLWNIDWMRTMQDADGGVYHKLTTANFSGFVMPAADNAPRYVVAKSTAATLDFAAVMAQTSRIFRRFEAQRPGFADSCLRSAIRAWDWARANPAVAYNQGTLKNPEVVTGTYGDGTFTDERIWAAFELTLATRRDSFWIAAFPTKVFSGAKSIPGWNQVAALGLMSAFKSMDSLAGVVDTAGMQASLRSLGNEGKTRRTSTPYLVPVRSGDLYWGSSSVTGNIALAALHWYDVSRDTSYRNTAAAGLDWILGRNALGISYVTGFGTVSPMNPHHRPSGADGITAPIPGFIVGGPNGQQSDAKDCEAAGASYPYESSIPAISWIDHQCSYASNEVAINWNAPLVAILGVLQQGELSQWEPDAVSPRAIARSSTLRLLASGARGLTLESVDGSALQEIRILDTKGALLLQAQPGTASWSAPVLKKGIFFVQARTQRGWSSLRASSL